MQTKKIQSIAKDVIKYEIDALQYLKNNMSLPKKEFIKQVLMKKLI